MLSSSTAAKTFTGAELVLLLVQQQLGGSTGIPHKCGLQTA